MGGRGGFRASIAPPCSRRHTVADVNQLLFVMKRFLFPVGNSWLAPPPSDVASLSNTPTDPLLRNPAAFFATFPLFKTLKINVKNVRLTRTGGCSHRRVAARRLPRRSAPWSARSSC